MQNAQSQGCEAGRKARLNRVVKPLHAFCSKSEQCTHERSTQKLPYVCKYAPQPKHVSCIQHQQWQVWSPLQNLSYHAPAIHKMHVHCHILVQRLSGAALPLTSAQNKSKASCNSWSHSASSVLPHALLYSFELHPGLWLTRPDDAVVACSDHTQSS